MTIAAARPTGGTIGPMRIALYHNLLSGGAKRAMAELTRRLAVRHEIDAYALGSSNQEFADLRPHVASHHVVPFQPLPLLRTPFGRANQALRCADLARLDRVGRQLARRIEGGGYDVVFAHPCQFGQSPGILRHLERLPSVYYCQEPPRRLYEAMPPRPYDEAATGLRQVLHRVDPLPALYRRTLRQADQANTRAAGSVVVNSRYMAGAVRSIYGLDARVSYLGVDVARFTPPRDVRRNVVLSVGSLTPLKGFDFLIQAMARYPAANRPPLVIASNFQNPPERSYLERMARELRVEIQLLENVSEAHLLRLYGEARVVAYAPVREPFGLVPLEAMACATPVVAVAEGGVAESVLDGHTGMLTSRDPALFAAAVQRLVEDPALARQYGENGRDHVSSCWTWDRAVASIEAHLAGAAFGSGFPPPVSRDLSVRLATTAR